MGGGGGGDLLLLSCCLKLVVKGWRDGDGAPAMALEACHSSNSQQQIAAAMAARARLAWRAAAIKINGAKIELK